MPIDRHLRPCHPNFAAPRPVLPHTAPSCTSGTPSSIVHELAGHCTNSRSASMGVICPSLSGGGQTVPVSAVLDRHGRR
ncbi:hypothetical protein KC324_g85 [Hortaea werneckii]|nr:hypothetical protein KC324_g85 [Hortaea werneckii]